MFMKIQLGVFGLYTLVSLFLTTSFALDFWDGWSVSTLAPHALAFGFSWPAWALA